MMQIRRTWRKFTRTLGDGVMWRGSQVKSAVGWQEKGAEEGDTYISACQVVCCAMCIKGECRVCW